jgi:hypothetical protein
MKILDPIQQYLQFDTKTGGHAYLEIANAYDVVGKEDDATKIYERLAESPHPDIRKKSRELLAKQPRPTRAYRKNVWNFFLGTAE